MSGMVICVYKSNVDDEEETKLISFSRFVFIIVKINAIVVFLYAVKPAELSVYTMEIAYFERFPVNFELIGTWVSIVDR